MTNLIKLLVFLTAAVISSQSFASTPSPMIPVTVYEDRDETSASIGLRFDFGDMQPQLVIGVSQTETDKNNDVTGIKGDIAIPIDPNSPPSAIFRILGIFGTTDAQGVAGVGFNTKTNQPLVGGGIQVPYAEGGVNVELDGKISPYVGVNTDDGPEDRESRTEMMDIIIPD